MSNLYHDKFVDCSKCGCEAMLTETSNPETKTMICLVCGYYKSGNVELTLQLNDINKLRGMYGMEPIEKRGK